MPNYPTSLDTLTNPASGDPLSSPAHHTQHTDANDILEAVETKLGTGASTPTTTGHVLTVTGAGATAYQAAAGGISHGMGLVASGAYLGPTWWGTTAGTALPLNRLCVAPLQHSGSVTVDRIGIWVTAGGTTGAVLRFGIYEDDDGKPGALVVDAGSAASESSAVFVEITISETLTEPHWLAVVSQVAACSVSAFSAYGVPSKPSATAAGSASVTYQNAISGALPDPFVPNAAQQTITPYILLRRA